MRRCRAVADVYGVFIIKRAHKEARSHSLAKEILLAGQKSHFDLEWIDIFFLPKSPTLSLGQQIRQLAQFLHFEPA